MCVDTFVLLKAGNDKALVLRCELMKATSFVAEIAWWSTCIDIETTWLAMSVRGNELGTACLTGQDIREGAAIIAPLRTSADLEMDIPHVQKTL